MSDGNHRPGFAETGINLASAGLGAKALFASDEFFAPLERMLSDAAPIFTPDTYDENGKWMDGWESRRKRTAGHDFAVIALAVPGRIAGFDVNTAHFTGNYAPACRIEACMRATAPDAATEWTEILPVAPLGPDAHHYFECTSDAVWSHIRLSILPDGGVARLKVYGQPEIKPAPGETIDLAASLNGGRILAVSDAHYGDYRRVLAPGRGRDMGDGWETARRRGPGHDWMLIKLATRGVIERAVIDTAHYKGNFPDRAALTGADMGDAGAGMTDALIAAAMFWPALLPEQKLAADTVHEFGSELAKIGPITHVMLNIYPDGGVSRLKLFGQTA